MRSSDGPNFWNQARYKESENYGNFQRYIMEDLLGFENTKHERENIDFVVNNRSLVVECKGTRTDLDEKQYRKNESHGTPMNQLWDYMRHGELGLITNYRRSSTECCGRDI